ncbi:Gfo/Idh/MocA family oxidoreductase [Actinoplanes sp. NPDC051851]|uniref:Gfo/Idh/MocA family protein n=1 Tax=Actinoplanes sp. NPDC051851 TaxID=3154753 RepID=UPI003419C78E
MTRRQRSGVIGAGFMGEVHSRAVRAAGGEVTVVAAASPGSARAAVDRLHAGRAAASAEELIAAEDVDIVHICTPNHLHVPLALAAIEAGKHVICEKPLAIDAADAARLTDAAAAAGVIAAVPFVYRFYPTVRDARTRVQRGDAGELRLLHGSYLQDWLAAPDDTNWRVDAALGGASRAFGDIGVHWCDLVEFASGHRIARLCARVLTTHDRRPAPADSGTRTGIRERVGTEDVATVLFETDRGALGSVVISQITHGRKNRLWFSLDGSEASLSFDQELPDTLWVGGRDQNATVFRGATRASRYDVLPTGHPQGYQDCFTAFVNDVYAAVAGDPPDGLPTFADGRRAAALTAAVLDAAKTGSWVEVL